ncbi:hypothetical protein ACJ6WF_20175 [Streptomyces sp. MMS24-I2-30]|uniref:hypothetical protein n=1 Tax=Streptomyces sp. MMS24-I2-30 TaxID=3351564 RepID=UPI0038968638
MRGTGTGTGAGAGTGPDAGTGAAPRTEAAPRTRAVHRPWTGLAQGRRGAVTAASAAAVCLGAVLASCGGGGGGGGYVAVGAPGGSPQAPSGTSLKPSAPVTLVPLDGSPGADGNSPGTGPASQQRPVRPTPGGSGTAGNDRTGSGVGGEGSAADGAAGTGAPAPPGDTAPTGTGTGSPVPPTSPGGPATPPTPAALTWDDPARKSTDKRWCEKVTVTFHNTGGTAVRSGTVTFGTHVIGALGIDWATVESTVVLPVPLGPKAEEDHTWTVCVDAWRVPLGMRIETQDVSVTWK